MRSVPFLLAAVGATALLASCSRPQGDRWQGYFEGDYVYVSSPIAGRLDALSVARGDHVRKGAPLFVLERASELAAQAQAAAELEAAKARLADATKGARPSELASLEARVQQAQASAELSKIELERQTKLLQGEAISQNAFDRARLTALADQRAVQRAKDDLATAKLPARSDAVRAAEAAVDQAIAAKAKADWAVDQKGQTAPADALVFDTLYRVGEFVQAGGPVVVLLPPANIKVRFFVDEPSMSKVQVGQHVSIAVTGSAPLAATITYLAPQAEYTPPVLFNRDNRSKLSFMVEARLEAPSDALHPGQPVDVTPAP